MAEPGAPMGHPYQGSTGVLAGDRGDAQHSVKLYELPQVPHVDASDEKRHGFALCGGDEAELLQCR